jgi:hypothetical protein
MMTVRQGLAGAAEGFRRTAAALCVLGPVALLAGPAHSQELDRDTAVAIGVTPMALKACVLGGNGLTACPPEHGSEPRNRIRLEWMRPPVGTVSHYEVYRYRVVTGNVVTDLRNRVAVCGTATTRSCGSLPATSTIDAEQPAIGGSHVYFVVAEFDDGTRSGPSNFATIEVVE